MSLELLHEEIYPTSRLSKSSLARFFWSPARHRTIRYGFSGYLRVPFPDLVIATVTGCHRRACYSVHVWPAARKPLEPTDRALITCVSMHGQVCLGVTAARDVAAELLDPIEAYWFSAFSPSHIDHATYLGADVDTYQRTSISEVVRWMAANDSSLQLTY